MEKEISLTFQSSSEESDNLIVCLHGNSADSNYFLSLLNEFDGWKVVAPDYIGHGKSPRLNKKDYNFEVFIQCLVSFINQFTYKKLVVIGHSMGGNLATELMRQIKMDGLLLLASPPVSYTSNFSPYLKLPDFELSDNEEENSIQIESYFSALSFNKNVINYLKKAFLVTDPHFRSRLLEEFANMKFSDQLEILKQNKSVFTGSIIATNDFAANNDFLNHLNSEEVFDFHTKITDSGHYSLLEKQSENIESIKTFLEKLE